MNLRLSIAGAALTAAASFGLAASPALALNPQPLPPIVQKGFLNPQPLPPIVQDGVLNS